MFAWAPAQPPNNQQDTWAEGVHTAECCLLIKRLSFTLLREAFRIDMQAHLRGR